jgi:hypothetical protein
MTFRVSSLLHTVRTTFADSKLGFFFKERINGTALEGRLKHVSDNLKKKAYINYGTNTM